MTSTTSLAPEELPPVDVSSADGWMAATWDAVASAQVRLQSQLSEEAGMQEVFEAIRPFLHGLAVFERMGLASISEDRLGVEVGAVDLEANRELLQSELHYHVDEGAFAWALYQNRPVVVRGGPLGPWTVLHALATPSRVIGMFIGSLPSSAPYLPDAAHTALSIVLMNCAGVIESADLHQSLSEHAASLERKVLERTEALRHSEAAAQHANHVKSEFLANMSHEMRTPLNGIVGMTSLLETTPLNGEQRDQVNAIRRSADDLLLFISDLLDSSKAEAGQLTIESVRLDLHDILEGVIDLQAPRAARNRVELVLRYDPSVPRVMRGDPTRIRQVVGNLVSNAIKFTERGRIIVSVSADAEGIFTVSVQDTGIGIHPDHVERIFDAFVQADSSTTRRFGGTGLGLAIGKTLAELMGGGLAVESILGGGSTFRFSFQPFDVSPRTQSPDRSLAGEDFLVVSDRPELVGAVSAMVRDSGGRVVVASALDGELALERAVASGWSRRTVMIDGVWAPAALSPFVATLRRDAPDARIIGLVPYGESEDSKTLLESGYDELVQRPIRERRFYDAIHGKRREATVGSSVAPLAPARVLVADDNPVNIAVARGMVERLGSEAVPCANGQEAVEAIAQSHFDIVLMDCQMPVMDGYDATRAVRKAGNDIPIIALTASARDQDAQRSLDAGMDRHLTKPLTLAKLREALAEWIPEVGGGNAPAQGARRHRESVEAPVRARDTPDLDSTTRQPIPEPETGPPIFDIDVVSESTGGDSALIAEIAHMFLDTASSVIEDLRRARWADDSTELASLAHRVKGGALNIGATRLAGVADRAESTWRSGDLSDVDVRIGRLNQEFADFGDELQKYQSKRDVR